MFVPNKSEHMDREIITEAIDGGAHSYVKMLTLYNLTDPKKLGGGGVQ